MSAVVRSCFGGSAHRSGSRGRGPGLGCNPEAAYAVMTSLPRLAKDCLVSDPESG
jgi:hypothetical protein